MPLYRVENLDTNKGLWYFGDQSASKLVHDLALSGKDLPMDFDEAISKEKWRSAAESIEQLKFWFSHEDLLKLTPLDFRLYEIEASAIRENKTEFYCHPLFQEDSVISRKELDIVQLLMGGKGT